MLARERWELAAIEEQRRAQEKERVKVEFRYGIQFSCACTVNEEVTIVDSSL